MPSAYTLQGQVGSSLYSQTLDRIKKIFSVKRASLLQAKAGATAVKVFIGQALQGFA
jgi:hypothetical protein